MADSTFRVFLLVGSLFLFTLYACGEEDTTGPNYDAQLTNLSDTTPTFCEENDCRQPDAGEVSDIEDALSDWNVTDEHCKSAYDEFKRLYDDQKVLVWVDSSTYDMGIWSSNGYIAINDYYWVSHREIMAHEGDHGDHKHENYPGSHFEWVEENCIGF